MSSKSISKSNSSRFLKLSIKICFAVAVLGQFIFALYILGLYGVSGVAGDFERWNEASTHGYVEKDTFGNVLFGIHIFLAAVITIGGPLQLMKIVRNCFPKFHRINGRLYIFSALILSLAGFYLVWVRGIVGGLEGRLFISVNAVLILTCAYFTIKKAVAKQFTEHRKWAIRLFLCMSGVWFFRVFLMLWFTIHQGPYGFDMETFQGPALILLYTFSYILPVITVEGYFRLRDSNKQRQQWAFASFTVLLTLCLAIGIFAATMGMWLPSI